MNRRAVISACAALALALPASAMAGPRLGDVVSGALSLAGPDSLGAGWRERQDEARSGVRAGRLVPMGQVIEQIRRRTPGRQLDAGLEEQNGRPVYRVRWAADNGRRIEYIVDAQTGSILSADGG